LENYFPQAQRDRPAAALNSSILVSAHRLQQKSEPCGICPGIRFFAGWIPAFAGMTAAQCLRAEVFPLHYRLFSNIPAFSARTAYHNILCELNIGNTLDIAPE